VTEDQFLCFSTSLSLSLSLSPFLSSFLFLAQLGSRCNLHFMWRSTGRQAMWAEQHWVCRSARCCG